jgi:hypothetical protein
MARCSYGALVTEIKGSIGGTTFQSNKYGFTIKNKPNQPNPSGFRQLPVQNCLSRLSAAWRSMDSSYRDLYNNFAIAHHQYSWNNPLKQLDGFAVFCRYNMLPFLNYVDFLNIFDDLIPVLPAFDITFLKSGVHLVVSPNPFTSNSNLSLDIYVSAAVNVTNNKSNQPIRYAFTISEDSFDVELDFVYSTYNWHLPNIGQWIYCKYVVRSQVNPFLWQPISGYFQIH